MLSKSIRSYFHELRLDFLLTLVDLSSSVKMTTFELHFQLREEMNSADAKSDKWGK